MRGSGLGNRLFPWARCKFFSERTGAEMLAPQWVMARLGPFLVGGAEVRSYHRQFLLVGQFRADGYVTGARRLLISSIAERRAEPAPGDGAVLATRGRWPVLVSFVGDGNHFADFAGQRDVILRWLRAEARPEWVTVADRTSAPIGINVKCNNQFKTAETPSDYFTRGGLKTPLEWFIRALDFVRAVAGRTVPAVVVSDGTEEQLQPLLSMPDVSFARPGSAISDLLALAHVRVLIGSGGSSFSAWAAFLSGATTLTHPGQSLQWFKVETANEHFVGEFDPAAPPPLALVEELRERLDRNSVRDE